MEVKKTGIMIVREVLDAAGVPSESVRQVRHSGVMATHLEIWPSNLTDEQIDGLRERLRNELGERVALVRWQGRLTVSIEGKD
jgi:hypothetical protein